MELIKANLKGVVGSSKHGIPLSMLEDEYIKITNSSINYRDFGYPDLKSFLYSLSDIVILQMIDNNCHVFLVTTEDDPQCLKKLCNLIQKTKAKKPKQMKNENIPKNVMEKATGFTKLKVSVTNEFCKQDTDLRKHQPSLKTNVNDRKGPNGQKVTSKTKGSVKGQIKNGASGGAAAFNKENNKYAVSRSLIGSKSSETNFKAEENDSQFNSKTSTTAMSLIRKINKIYLRDFDQNTASHQEQLSFNGTMGFETKINGGGGNSSMAMAEIWPLHFEISVNIFQSPVLIFGIQSGFGLVSPDLDYERESGIYIEAKLCDNEMPGDILVWQPPIMDYNRSRTTFDTRTAFLVIVLETSSNASIRVRIMGLRVCLDVRVDQLFEFPKNVQFARQFRSHLIGRQLTFVRMAYVPSFMDMWDEKLLSEVYFCCPVIITHDNDECLLESCDNRGIFLNLILLIHMSNVYSYSKLPLPRLRTFNQNIIHLMGICKEAVLSTYEDMLVNRDPDHFSSDSRMLLSIENEFVSLENRTFIGSPQILTSYRHCYNLNNQTDLRIERITYRAQSRTFHYLDDKDFTEVHVPFSYPIYGLYILNEKFLHSRLPHTTKLRFQVAVLMKIRKSKLYEVD